MKARAVSAMCEHGHQTVEGLVDLGDVRVVASAEVDQREEALADVFKRNRLQFAAALHLLGEGAERHLDGDAALRKPVEHAAAIEPAQRGDARVVGLAVEIAPRGQLVEDGVQFGGGRRLVRPLCLREYLGRPDVKQQLTFSCRAHIQDRPVQRRIIGGDVTE